MSDRTPLLREYTVKLASLGLMALAMSAVPLLSLRADASAAPTCAGLPATIVGTPGRDNIRGTPGADVIVGLGGIDSIRGLAGNDVICGGRRFDEIRGGAGNDIIIDRRGSSSVLWGDTGDDVLVGPGNPAAPYFVSLHGGPGDDRLVLRGPGQVLFNRFGHPVRVDLRAGTASGQGHDRIRLGPHDGGNVADVPRGSVVRGTRYGDTMTANGSLLIGRRGDDTFVGNSRAYGGSGNDVFDAFVSRAGRHIHFPRYYGNRGQDTFTMSAPVLRGIAVDGGPGVHDKVYLSVERPGPTGPNGSTATVDLLRVDLAAGLVQADAASFPLRSIGDVDLSLADPSFPLSSEIDGTDGPNTIGFEAPPLFMEAQPAVTVRARQGNDAILTSAGDDTVYGGAGYDSADTGGGSDNCLSVEVRFNCELFTP
jgi:Ca2+-binding RTX toxin-like protein